MKTINKIHSLHFALKPLITKYPGDHINYMKESFFSIWINFLPLNKLGTSWWFFLFMFNSQRLFYSLFLLFKENYNVSWKINYFSLLQYQRNILIHAPLKIIQNKRHCMILEKWKSEIAASWMSDYHRIIVRWWWYCFLTCICNLQHDWQYSTLKNYLIELFLYCGLL